VGWALDITDNKRAEHDRQYLHEANKNYGFERGASTASGKNRRRDVG